MDSFSARVSSPLILPPARCQRIKEQTRQSLANVKAILAEEGLDINNVVKTTVLLADMSLFAEMNEVYGETFSQPYPARSAFAVKALPMGALVEIEVRVSR